MDMIFLRYAYKISKYANRSEFQIFVSLADRSRIEMMEEKLKWI